MYEENNMFLEDRLFQQEWVQNLTNEEFRLLMYLFVLASKKTGIIELNMRMINFVSNTGKMFTIDDVFKMFGVDGDKCQGLIRPIPGKKNTAIFPDYVSTNWNKNGQPIDPVRNPLFKSVVQELALHGMTIADVNAMAKKKIVVKGEEDATVPVGSDRDTARAGTGQGVMPQTSVTAKDIAELFDAFWSAYPSSCPRKTEKKKCRDIFTAHMKKSKDGVRLFNLISEGLEEWKQCDTWTKDGGQFIMAPVRWLRNECWNDHPKKGVRHGIASGSRGSANANYKGSGAEGLF